MPSWAHHDPAVTVEQLNAQIALTPQMPELYYQRGVELSAMGQLEKAGEDFAKALSLRADYLPATRSLAQVKFQLQQPEPALALLQEAMQKAPAEHQFLIPGCRHLEGEILLKLGKNEAALKAFDQALLGTYPEIDTWRLRAEAQRLLGKTDEMITDLKNAWTKSSAIILRNEWLDALIEAGRVDEALPVIEQELATSRFRSSWLIRRARANLAGKKPDAAKQDLEEAIAELSGRLTVTPPPFSLLCDRGLAYALLGQKEQAAADLKQAIELGAPPGSCRLLTSVLAKK